MHGSGGSRGLLVHLMAGAALGAVVVLIVWIFSGGRPFGEVVGTSDVSEPTATPVQQTDVRGRAAAPAGTDARLEPEPPALTARKPVKAESGRAAIRSRRPAASRRKAERTAAQRREARKTRARRRQAVRVVAPPAGEVQPVAAVPSPAPTAAPPPTAAPAPPAKPAKPRSPSYVTGAGEG